VSDTGSSFLRRKQRKVMLSHWSENGRKLRRQQDVWEIQYGALHALSSPQPGFHNGRTGRKGRKIRGFRRSLEGLKQLKYCEFFYEQADSIFIGSPEIVFFFLEREVFKAHKPIFTCKTETSVLSMKI